MGARLDGSSCWELGLLGARWLLPEVVVFQVFSAGCKRYLQAKWLKKNSWLVYSEVLDGGFCIFCSLFIKDRSKYGVLVNTPFKKLVKVNKVVGGHSSNQYHHNAMADTSAFLQSVENPEKNVDVRINSILERTIKENRHIIQSFAEYILFCGQQCLALRGDCEVSGANGNPRNFLALMKLLAKHDPTINAHLESPKLRNASYISPHIQNELINIIGKNIIQKHLVNEVVSAKHFLIMIDEITSFNKEVMPLCVRFVDSNHDIREEFL